MTDILLPAQMLDKPHAIAYWLLPEPVAQAMFAKKIRELARRFSAPVFAPHVTVFIEPENSCDPAEILRQVGIVSIELRVDSIAFGEQFTKTLFVQFEQTSSIQELGDKIWKISGASQRYVIDPHLSLLYADLPLETKKSLASQIAFPAHKVRFTSIAAVRCARPTTTQNEVTQWRLVAP